MGTKAQIHVLFDHTATVTDVSNLDRISYYTVDAYETIFTVFCSLICSISHLTDVFRFTYIKQRCNVY